MQRVVIDALEDVKAQGIKVFNTVGLSDMFDRVVVASGTSNRQTRALADSVARKVKDAGGTVISVEGTETGEWVLVDLGDVVVHIMQPAIREYYGLEEMWGSKPLHVKLGADAPAPRMRDKVAGDRPSTPTTAARKAASGTVATKSAVTKARTPASKTTTARTAAPKKAAPKKAAPKKAAPKKAAPKKAALKKATTTKTTRKTAAPKTALAPRAAKKTAGTPARKSPARK